MLLCNNRSNDILSSSRLHCLSEGYGSAVCYAFLELRIGISAVSDISAELIKHKLCYSDMLIRDQSINEFDIYSCPSFLLCFIYLFAGTLSTS